MPFSTLIEPSTLKAHLGDAGWAVVDCRFSLNDPDRGRRTYAEGHIPGAVYAHLNDDLSAPVVQGRTGRHPLPDSATFARTLSQWGIDAGVQVVAYDDAGGAIAARLWWMLRWLGHDAVAVLDGGLPRWEAEGLPLTADVPERAPRIFVPRPQNAWLATSEEVARLQQRPGACLLDARDAARYRGDVEPIDSVAGHIPSAASLPFAENLAPDGRFRSSDVLRARFEQALGGTPPEQAVCYCGSGVTAAHNVLAMVHAGLPPARLYAGSWSEWITDAERPVATGDEA